MLVTAIERMRNKVFYTDIAFHFLPDKFTILDLKKVYEVISQKNIDNFRRFILDKVEETNEICKRKASKPAKLFKRKGDDWDV